MRTSIFLVALCAVIVAALAGAASVSQTSTHPEYFNQLSEHAGLPRMGTDGVMMWRRAEIRVLPMEVAVANRAELKSLEERVKEAGIDSARIDLSDPGVRQQVSRQLRLLEDLLSYAERQNSDEGKSRAAMDVQQHLNQIEGQMMCEACHSKNVAQLIPTRE
ncbi:MAG TPA: hypothetical protein VFA89_04225 [Terriglobales bacterium]|nr:hypothetical protein [Terriglobales bacterium]